MPDSPPLPSPDDLLLALESIVEALNRLDRTLREIGGLAPGGGFIREQTVPPPMPRLVAGQWPVRDGNDYPRGA